MSRSSGRLFWKGVGLRARDVAKHNKRARHDMWIAYACTPPSIPHSARVVATYTDIDTAVSHCCQIHGTLVVRSIKALGPPPEAVTARDRLAESSCAILSVLEGRYNLLSSTDKFRLMMASTLYQFESDMAEQHETVVPDEELKAIEERQAIREAQQCLSTLNGGTCTYGEWWICADHRDPDDTEADVRTLLAELRRIKENPDCPACGHSVKEHRGAAVDYWGDAEVDCFGTPDCPCEDWRMP